MVRDKAQFRKFIMQAVYLMHVATAAEAVTQTLRHVTQHRQCDPM